MTSRDGPTSLEVSVVSASPTTSDPASLFRELTAEQVRARLDVIEAERKALLVLLRSLMARDRAARRREVGHVR
jgi:hypothetical protein